MDRYKALLNELLDQRKANGGELPIETESDYVARLDAVWRELTSAEQDSLESQFAEGKTGHAR